MEKYLPGGGVDAVGLTEAAYMGHSDVEEVFQERYVPIYETLVFVIMYNSQYIAVDTSQSHSLVEFHCSSYTVSTYHMLKK